MNNVSERPEILCDYFANRRSIRHFKDEELPQELLDEILGLAMKAPTTGNMQLYTVITSRKGPGREALEACHFKQPAAVSAPVLLTICADFERFTRWCRLSGADAGFDNFLSFMSACADATILAQQIATIAELKGLGTCYLGTVTYNAPRISELLHLPELCVPVACLAIGKSAGEGEATERLALESVVHSEVYPEISDEELLAGYRVKEDYAPNHKYVEENGKENLAQVFAEVRYPRAMNEEFTKSFLELRKEKKFI
ncbi:MAG: nitroreductase family protein [Muribaculaceae bacterium]|nr:nitroreductase family protein [Muribaculaceae bacterium]